jgi:hypothetical protein
MKVYALALTVSLAVLFTANDGRADDYMQGQRLNTLCSGDTAAALVCSGYIQGVHDAGQEPTPVSKKWRGGWEACVPGGVLVGQLKAVVTKWLSEHPEKWHFHAEGLVAQALTETWPCP